MQKKRFRVVAVGGTFDHLHKGHKALLSKTFDVGDLVVIGVTSDEFAKKLGKRLDHDYRSRVASLRRYLASAFRGQKYEIHSLNDYFGPAIYKGKVEAIVVSKETTSRVKMANDERRKLGYKPLRKVVIDWVLAEDGKPISSTRIRAGEIDEKGKLLRRQ